MSSPRRTRARLAALAVTAGVISLCAGASSAIGSTPPREHVPVQLLNSFPLNPSGQTVAHPPAPSTVPRSPRATPRSRRAAPVRPAHGGSPIGLSGVSVILVAAGLLLALVGALTVARGRKRGAVAPLPTPPTNGAVRSVALPLGGAVRLPSRSASAPLPLKFNRLRYADPQRKREGGSAGDAAFRKGLLLEEQGDLLGAEKAYLNAAKSGHLAAESNLGVLLHQRGELDAAERHYSRALQGGEPTGAFNLGVLLEEQRDLPGARSAYRQADRQGHAAAASNLGVLLEENGLLTLAHAAFGRADERGDPKGAINLGMVLEEQGDLAGAQAAYGRAVEYRRRAEGTLTAEASDTPRASA